MTQYTSLVMPPQSNTLRINRVQLEMCIRDRLKSFKIKKEESSSAGVRRIKAVIGQ